LSVYETSLVRQCLLSLLMEDYSLVGILFTNGALYMYEIIPNHTCCVLQITSSELACLQTVMRACMLKPAQSN